LAVLLIAVVVALGLVPVVHRAQNQAAARTAADAAALAGAAEGEDAAREVAAANGAEVTTWRAEGNEVWVVIDRGGTSAAAKAQSD
jgi:hypothetical protein